MGESENDPFALRDAARKMTREAMHAGAAGEQRPAASVHAGAKHAGAHPAGVRQRSMTRKLVLGACVCAAALLTLVTVAHHSATQDAGSQAATRAVPAEDIRQASEADVLAAPQEQFGVFRLAGSPSVIVLAFPSMHRQALALDRIGAFVEKAGMPHDRVLSAADLGARIVAAGDDFDTFYYGHDYRAADLARFYATAQAQGETLNAEERVVQALLQREGLFRPNAVGALISVPAQSERPAVDAESRATILRHEVSHGVYFTDAAYAQYTQRFWSSVMTEAERSAFRKMLGSDGYDMTNDDLMRNEMQAYLVHTPDRRFFNPARLRIDTTSLRARFVQGMPAGWLRDETH